MGAIEVHGFTGEPDALEAFVDMPYRILVDDPHSLAQPRERALASVTAAGTVEERRFLACRNGEPIARCIATVNPHLAAESPPVGLVGFFESVNDPEPACEVLAAAREWLAERGIERVRGPVNRDTWHSYRFMVSGFDGDPILMEPRNPIYYPDLFKQAGFQEVARYITTQNHNPAALRDRHMPFLNRCLRNGYTFRSLDMAHFEDELVLLHRISLDAFPGNFSYSPISEASFKQLYLPTMPFIDPAIVILAFDPEDKPAGYFFAVPEWTPVLLAGGKPSGDRRRHPEITTMNCKTVCAIPARRGSGLGWALAAYVYDVGLQRGYTHSRHCLMKMSNVSRRYDEGEGVVMKEYALYERDV